MNKQEFVDLLKALIRHPYLVKHVGNKLDTIFGTLEFTCMGSCIDLITDKDVRLSIDILDSKEEIHKLIDEIKKSVEEYSIIQIKKEIVYYDNLSSDSTIYNYN